MPNTDFYTVTMDAGSAVEDQRDQWGGRCLCLPRWVCLQRQQRGQGTQGMSRSRAGRKLAPGRMRGMGTTPGGDRRGLPEMGQRRTGSNSEDN